MDFVDEEQYVQFIFKENIDSNYFLKPNLFFKVVNLDTKRPFVQIGNLVFSGQYDSSSIGTNLFFEGEQIESQPQKDAFEKTFPFRLKYITKTSKVVTLQWQDVSEEMINIEQSNLVDVEFSDSYDLVLDKIQNRALNINDIIVKNDLKPEAAQTKPKCDRKKEKGKKDEEEPQNPIKTEPEVILNVSEEVIDQDNNVTNAKLNKLKDFVRNTKQPQYYEKVGLDDLKTDLNFSILKELHLKEVDYKTINLNIDNLSVEDYVDVQNSIKDGIINDKPADQLSDKDLQALVSLNNFDNLSVGMQLTILIEHLSEQKKAMKKLSLAERDQADRYGRIPKQRYKLLKSLAKDLKYHMFLHIREQRCFDPVIHVVS